MVLSLSASANDLGVISTTLQAVPGQSEVCFDISIIDDPFVEELLECFTLEIDLGPNSPDDIILNPSTDAVCCIEDNDRKCCMYPLLHTTQLYVHSKIANQAAKCKYWHQCVFFPAGNG